MLPLVFAFLAGLALLASIAALWQSMRAAFGGADMARWAPAGESVERQGLLDEKRSVLESIKDLEFEHQTGKISDKDYQRLDRSLRTRAREVLRLLDEDVGPYRARAQELIQKHLAEAVEQTPYRKAAEPASAPVSSCPECGTANDPDAKFCKECAHRFDGGEQATPAVDADEGGAARGEAEEKEQ